MAYYFIIILLIGVLWNSSRNLPVVRASVKVKHWLSLIFLMALNAEAINHLFWLVRSPAFVFRKYYVPVGYFPAWLVLSSEVLSVILGVFMVFICLSLAQRSENARLLFLKIWPILLFAAFFQFMIGAQRVRQSDFIFFLLCLICFVVLGGGLLLVIYRFFASSETKEFFTNKNATVPAARN